MKALPVILIICLSIPLSAQQIIDITVKGISDSKKDGAQQDRLEAIMDAKRQACEKAGMTLESKTKVKNFKTEYDYVETQSKGVLLAGFQIVDVGYLADGTYQVVLSGKIKKSGEDKIVNKELRYAKSLNERGKSRECIDILLKYIDSKDEKVSEELKEESHYYLIKWGYARDIQEHYEKFAAYYPQSKYLNTLTSFAAFTAKPLYEHNKNHTLKKSRWKKKKYEHDGLSFNKQISVIKDTIILKDFKNREHTLLVDYTYYLNTDENVKKPRAYHFKITCYPENITKAGTKKKALPEPKIVDERFSAYLKTSSNSFQFNSSDKRFGNFRLSDYALKGVFPIEETCEQSVRFTISQRSF